MVNLISPKRGESILDVNGYPTLRFLDYLDSNTGTTNTGNDNIETNTANIATNTSDIGINSGNITTNTDNITTLYGSVVINTSDIGINTSDITTVSGNLTDHEAAYDPHIAYYLTDGTKAISGDLEHTGSGIGFYGVTPTARPTAYLQTYSTASRTHSNLTSSGITTTFSGISDTTIVTISGTSDDTNINNNFLDLVTEINNLRIDLINVKNVLNQSIDDDQLQGLKQ